MIGGTGTITLKQDTVLGIFNVTLFLENFRRGTFNGTFYPKMKDLLALMLCQTCMNVFLLWRCAAEYSEWLFSIYAKHVVTTDCQAVKYGQG